MKLCRKCQTLHFKEGIFCGRKCSNSRTWSDVDKLKKSIAAKNSEKLKIANDKRQITITKVCEVCGTLCKSNNAKTCSVLCRHIFISKSHKENNVGGYREGSGNSKSGYVRGIFCNSTYELVWVIHRLDHGLSVKRFTGSIKDDESSLVYVPDFIEGNTIYEIKGYHTNSVDTKTKLAMKNGYNVKVLYKTDLTDAFKWCKIHYPHKHLTELYDDHAPKYEYVCNCCHKSFSANKQRTTEKVYCSRNCSMKTNHYKRRC